MEEHVSRFVAALRARGATVHAPESLELDPAVQVERFGQRITLHAGTRLRGARTAVLDGAVLGAEAPLTLEDTVVGPGARLAGGFVQGAVVLDGARIGSGAHVREATLLEEGARVAHTVGLKHSFLLSFATLGSLINFCDCLLAGGSGPRDHSEVGSGFIHFNFTPRGPRGDKATPSLFGDVPRGVLLDQRRIFLGGDGGVVGPVQVGFGAVLGAGSTYRRDCPDDLMRTAERVPSVDAAFDPLVYGDVSRKWHHNLAYLGNLLALLAWYRRVRRPSVPAGETLRAVLLDEAVATIVSGVRERVRRVDDFVAALEISLGRLSGEARHSARSSQEAARAAWPGLRDAIEQRLAGDDGPEALRESFLGQWRETPGEEHVVRVRALAPSARELATRWLQAVAALQGSPGSEGLPLDG